MTLYYIISLCSVASAVIQVKTIWKMETLKRILQQNWTRLLSALLLSNADNNL